MNHQWFWIVCGSEALLSVLAIVIGGAIGFQPVAHLRWDGFDLLAGLAGVVPIFALFYWSLRSSASFFNAIRTALEHAFRPVFESWSVWQLAVASLCAGVGEEVLFRGLIQGWLQTRLDAGMAILISNAAFGLLHPLNRQYVLVAGLIGCYLGWLFLWSGNLLVPIVVHAVYDFAALVYFLRFTPRQKD